MAKQLNLNFSYEALRKLDEMAVKADICAGRCRACVIQRALALYSVFLEEREKSHDLVFLNKETGQPIVKLVA